MIPTIGIMIGVYTSVKLLSLAANQKEHLFVRILAILACIVVSVGGFSLLFTASGFMR